jgi:hypothetical protein
MNDEWQFKTPYLRTLDAHLRNELQRRRIAWGLDVKDFYHRIEAWFKNFQLGDQPLALKLMLNLQYLTESDFKREVSDWFVQIEQYLFTAGGSIQDLRLVLPSSRGDSADKHGYLISKAWNLPREQLVTVDQLSRVDPGCVLVFFNDTHGTGNQFLREAFSRVKKENFKAVFVVAITIAERALLRFNHELKGIRVIPDTPTPSIFDEFTAREVNRLRELGAMVYPKHPFGYGGAGLLVSYWFQCPNNTLPLIWASHALENNRVDGRCYPWTPLFPYLPKPKSATAPPEPDQPSEQAAPDLAALDGKWQWSDSERADIVQRIAQWGLASDKFYRRVGAWFRNFGTDEREAALEIFVSTTYLDLAKVRNAIRDLRKELMTELGRVGGDLGDVILVTTGDENASVYHYMYEFMREWHLNVDQVCSLDKLGPDRVIDKTLVFFYHTRGSGLHFEQHHMRKLEELAPRANVFAAYAMSEEAVSRFGKMETRSPNRAMCCAGASRTVAKLTHETQQTIARIEKRLALQARMPERSFLTAYYFQCPADTSPLLWLEQAPDDGRDSWLPLFKRIELPTRDF